MIFLSRQKQIVLKLLTLIVTITKSTPLSRKWKMPVQLILNKAKLTLEMTMKLGSVIQVTDIDERQIKLS